MRTRAYRRWKKQNNNDKTHYCSGPCCKPWKHGFEPKYTVAERRRLQNG